MGEGCVRGEKVETGMVKGGGDVRRGGEEEAGGQAVGMS